MLHIRPDPGLKAQECNLRVSIQPLRLNVDQVKSRSAPDLLTSPSRNQKMSMNTLKGFLLFTQPFNKQAIKTNLSYWNGLQNLYLRLFVLSSFLRMLYFSWGISSQKSWEKLQKTQKVHFLIFSQIPGCLIFNGNYLRICNRTCWSSVQSLVDADLVLISHWPHSEA